jgi:hypothetical protein
MSSPGTELPCPAQPIYRNDRGNGGAIAANGTSTNNPRRRLVIEGTACGWHGGSPGVSSGDDRHSGMTFLALVDVATADWRADSAALMAVMRSGWSQVETGSSALSEARSVVWTFRTDVDPAEAYLHRDGTCLYTDASLADAARLAVLLRGLAPEYVKVIFCHDGYNFDVHVTRQMTAADLVSAVGCPGPMVMGWPGFRLAARQP